MKESKFSVGLNLFPQTTYHADAAIVGTEDGLIALSNAITSALLFGKSEVKTFASDGEGYTLTIRNLNDNDFRNESPFYSMEC
jgi:hypothetical protein